MSREPEQIGGHYTPDELADELAEVALEPHLDEWSTPGDILRLNVVDLACGDGALLAAATRALSRRLISAAARFDGQLLLPAQAARLVQRCLIGNDLHPGAVEDARRRLPWASIDRGDALFDVDIDPQGGPLVFIGNPPFLGGSKISGTFGADYYRRLKKRFPSFGGRADLSACFLLVAADIARRARVDATISFITTKTIAEGDTHKAGLGLLCHPNDTGVWSIWHAWRSRPWPGAAKVNIAIVHLMNESLGRRLGFAPSIDKVYRRFGEEPDPELPAPSARHSPLVPVMLNGEQLGVLCGQGRVQAPPPAPVAQPEPPAPVAPSKPTRRSKRRRPEQLGLWESAP